MSNYVRRIVDAAKLYKDPGHKKIMSTKRKLQEDDDYETQEAIKYAVKMRKFLIQQAAGTLRDEENFPHCAYLESTCCLLTATRKNDS